MNGFNYTFDATQFAPDQGGSAHPIGKYHAVISNTAIQPTKDNSGGMFVVEYTTEAGKISQRFNLWNQNETAVRIAHGQLSALCHVVGIYKVDMQNEGAALRNARLMIEVGKQKGEENYTEVKKVYDANGNEPGKGGGAPQAPQPSQQPGFGSQPQQPPQGQPAQQWGQPQQGQPPAAAPQPGAPTWGGPGVGGQPQGQPQGGGQPWGGGQPAPAAPQAPAPAQQGQGWQQGGGAPQGQPPANAPWGAR